MRRLFVSIFLGLCASQSFAQSCPDFYRFVDFGLVDREGVMVRGGVILRAEDFDGSYLILAARSECTDVYDLAKDGRGNPVPVVSEVSFDPEQIGLFLTRLRVATAPDTAILAEQNRAAHASRLTQTNATVVQGPDYVCVQIKDETDTSCQFAAGFQADFPLVVYCDAALCSMPVMAITDRIFVQAEWPSVTAQITDLDGVAAQNLAQLTRIQNLLEPLFSGL